MNYKGFEELIRRVREGDEEAAAQLVRDYEPAIRRAARIRLADSHLKKLFDSVDISQSVFASFFARVALGQYQLDKPQALIRLLAIMTRNKLVDHFRRETTGHSNDLGFEEAGQFGERIPAANTCPSQDLTAQELLNEFHKRLSPEERLLVQRRLEGRAWLEIAAEQKASPEALRKKLGRAIIRISSELGIRLPRAISKSQKDSDAGARDGGAPAGH
jgi:RNA polymerase sigma-70 factor (ECF subfamily)